MSKSRFGRHFLTSTIPSQLPFSARCVAAKRSEQAVVAPASCVANANFVDQLYAHANSKISDLRTSVIERGQRACAVNFVRAGLLCFFAPY